MNWFSAFVLFAVIWFLTLFVVLPLFGVLLKIIAQKILHATF